MKSAQTTSPLPDPQAHDRASLDPSGPHVHDVTPQHVVEHRVSRWRQELEDLAGASPLVDISVIEHTLVDLSSAHPSGTAQLFASDATKLSALFRESARLSQARVQIREITRQAQDIAAGHGVASTCLVLGIGRWTELAPAPNHGGDQSLSGDVAGGAHADPHAVVTHQVPVLLRPAHLKHTGGMHNDTAIELDSSAFLNPVLLRELRQRSALIDPDAVVRDCFTSSGFEPWAVLDRLEALAATVLPGFTMEKKIVIGSFVQPGQMMVDDLDELGPRVVSHPVVRALAGLEGQVAMPASGAEIDYVADPDHDPHSEPGVGDLNAQERFALDIATQGHHLFVDAPAGTDGTSVAVALAAQYARAGKTVAFVSGQRRAAQDFIAELDRHNLADTILDVPTGPAWVESVSSRLLSALTMEPSDFDHSAAHAVRQDLVARADQLGGYTEALHRKREPWGVSAYDCLEALAELASRRPAPMTAVRLGAEVARRLTPGERESLVTDLQDFSELGGFTHKSANQAWFGADIASPGQAEDALARVDRLLDNLLPLMSRQITTVTQSVGLIRPETVSQWQDELVMLGGMRHTLDVFLPLVFERTAKDLIVATSPRQQRGDGDAEMTALTRRRLRRQAMDMIRPGCHVEDLHGALIEIQRQRDLWQQYCPAGGWPRLPEGLGEVEATAHAVFADLAALEKYLHSTPAGSHLMSMNLSAVHDRLVRLRLDASALETLPRRTFIQRNVERLGAGALLVDLTDRRVDGKLVAAELDLAWWGSVLEEILRTEPALGTYDGAALDALSRRFSELDRAHLALQGPQIRHDFVRTVAQLLTVYRSETEAIFAQLIEGSLIDVRRAMSVHREVLPRLRPVMVAPAAQLSQVLPVDIQMDLVIFSGIEDMSTATLLSALVRGRQILILGDQYQSGGALHDLAEVLPRVHLGEGVTERDPVITDFLVRHGVDDGTLGWPRPTVRTTVHHEMVMGTGMPDSHTGMVATTPAEVERVIELAINHALMCPEESLAIIAGTPEHADRIREAIKVEIEKSPALQPFFTADGARSVAVCDITETRGLRRDAAIVSLGFGRTPHGRILHRFGALSTDAGLQHLLGAISATRCRLTVVSTFGAEDLDDGRLRTQGAKALKEFLALAAKPGRITAVSRGYDEDSGEYTAEPDTTHARLLLDLADRLWRDGLNVELDYGVTGGHRIPMAVGHPELPDRLLLAVLTDDDAYTAEPSIRLRDRQYADELRVLGWDVLQVWSAAVFLDPAAEAARIRDAVLIQAQEHLATKMPPPPPHGGFADLEVLEDLHPPMPTTQVTAQNTAQKTAQNTSRNTVQGAPQNSANAPTQATLFGATMPSVPPLTNASPQAAAVTGSPAQDSEPAPLRPGIRPNVISGLPISAYGDNDLDDLVVWLRSRGIGDDPAVLSRHMRDELGITRRSTRVDLAIEAALRRAELVD